MRDGAFPGFRSRPASRLDGQVSNPPLPLHGYATCGEGVQKWKYAADFIKLLKRIYSLIQVNYLNREWTDYVQMLFLGLLYSTFIIIFLALSLLQKLLQVTTLLRVPPMSLLLCAFTVRHGTCQQLRIMLSCTLKIKACISQFFKGMEPQGIGGQGP